MTPAFRAKSGLQILESSQAVLRQTQPLREVANRLRTAATALRAGAALLFGAAVGTLAAGPAPGLRPPPRTLDFNDERAQRMLGIQDFAVLQSHLAEHPEDRVFLNEAMRAPTLKEQREQLRAIVRIIVPDGESVRVERPNGEVLFERGHSTRPSLSFEVSAKLGEGKASGFCPTDMVYVPKFESGLTQALCVDEDDRPSAIDPTLPMVKVTFAQAEAACASAKARLPSSQEYQAIASFGGKRHYPTLDNTPRGIHYNADGPRVLKTDPAGNFLEFTQPDGNKRKIYNLTGNVWKILSDGNIAGGSWLNLNPKVVRADSRDKNDNLFDNGHYVGFRCVASPNF